jgi:hypothetical protein
MLPSKFIILFTGTDPIQNDETPPSGGGTGLTFDDGTNPVSFDDGTQIQLDS